MLDPPNSPLWHISPIYHSHHNTPLALFQQIFSQKSPYRVLVGDGSPVPKELKNIKLSIYFFLNMVYDMGEQSRRPCVKCCQNGELSDRRRALPAMRYPHPLRHIGVPPLCSNDTQLRAEPIRIHTVLPQRPWRMGIFLWVW